jgi:hypothetical protein
MTKKPLPINGARSVKPTSNPIRCPTCERPLVPDPAWHLPPIQKRILTLMERHGEIHREVLWTAIYGSDPNGGPESRQTLDVHINQLNKNLRHYGIAIRQHVPRKSNQPFRLVQIEEAAE